MCRTGGRRCETKQSEAHAQRINARRRVARNTAKEAAALEAGNTAAAQTYHDLALSARDAAEHCTAHIEQIGDTAQPGTYEPAVPRPDGYLDLYHRTTTDAAASINAEGRMQSKENRPEAYFSTFPESSESEGYGDAVVMIRVPEDAAEIDDEFPDGEEHYRVLLDAINSATLMQQCPDCGRWAGNSHNCPSQALDVEAEDALASLRSRLDTATDVVRNSHPLSVGSSAPVEFAYVRNPVSSTVHVVNHDFGQDHEPAGRYMSQQEGDRVPQGWQSGTVTFTKPLRMDFGGNYGEDDNWKSRLSNHYGGATGKTLSRKIRKDGYDAIITSDKYGPSEVVDLTSR